MASRLTSRLSRFSTGMTAFVVSGLLVFSILQGNGGSEDSQQKWQDASRRTIPIQRNGSGYLDQLIEKKAPQYIDQTISGSISKPVNEAGEVDVESDHEVISVLDLIRENADVAPGVSSGTARVSVTIKKGDTLFNISQRHGISVPDLARLNGLDEQFTIKIGQTLYVAR